MTDAEENGVLAWNKCIYGLVKATQQYRKKAFEVLHKIRFNGDHVDPCLFWKQYEKGVVFVAIYLNDILIVDYPDELEDTIKQLRKMDLLSKWRWFERLLVL